MDKLAKPGDLNYNRTLMGLRESFMEYFKGTCVERLSRSSNVYLDSIYANNLNHRYQREEWERKARLRVCLLNTNTATPIVRLEHVPDTAILLNENLGRSPELRQLREDIKHFFHRFLPDVKVSEEGELAKVVQSDNQLFANDPVPMQTQSPTTYGSYGLDYAVDWGSVNITSTSPSEMLLNETMLNDVINGWRRGQF